jgi:hypothetical protein
MAARHLLRQRHRVTTILISRPSCAGRQTEVCYNLGDKEGLGGEPPGPSPFCRQAVVVAKQATDFKSLIILSVI